MDRIRNEFKELLVQELSKDNQIVLKFEGDKGVSILKHPNSYEIANIFFVDNFDYVLYYHESFGDSVLRGLSEEDVILWVNNLRL